MQRHPAHVIQSHQHQHQLHNPNHQQMDQLQLHQQHHHLHQRPPDSQLHLAQHQGQQQDHYQQYQHDDQQQLAVGLQQHYQLQQQQQQPTTEIGCGSVHYGYTPVSYGDQPHSAAEQYEQQQQQHQPTSGSLESTEVEAELSYRLSQPISDQKPSLIEQWELNEHHLQQHHATSFAYINNYPFHPQQQQQQQQHEQPLHQHQPHPQLVNCDQQPLQPAAQATGESQVQPMGSMSPQQVATQAQPEVHVPLNNLLQHQQPQIQPRVRARAHTNRGESGKEQVEPTNGIPGSTQTKPRKKQNNAARPVDQLEGKYPKRIKIGEHEEIEYQRDGIIVRNNALQLNLSFSNKELGEMVAKSLNRRLSKASPQLTSLVKARRRTLKNRGYAANCRTRREAAKKDLEKMNKLLIERVNKLSIEISQINERLQLALSASCTCLRQQIQQIAF